MMQDYQTTEVKVHLKTMPASYENHLPKEMPYRELNQMFPDRPRFDMWEKLVETGQGWLAVVVDEKDSDLTIEGSFMSCLHTGEYQKLKGVYQQIMRDHPETKECYNVYLNDPRKTKPEDYRTKVIFR